MNGTSSTYNVPSSVAGTTYFRLIVTDLSNGCNDPLSNTVGIVISEDILVVTNPTDINECIGGTDQLTVAITGGSGFISYQWQSSTDGVSGWINASGPGSTTATYTPPSTTAGVTYYRVLINATNNGCGQAESIVVAVTVAEDLLVTVQPTNVNECIGGTDQMTVVVSGGSGSISTLTTSLTAWSQPLNDALTRTR